MSVVLTDKWLVLARHQQALEWLQVWADLGRAPVTISAYARGLAECLTACERQGVVSATANRARRRLRCPILAVNQARS